MRCDLSFSLWLALSSLLFLVNINKVSCAILYRITYVPQTPPVHCAFRNLQIAKSIFMLKGKSKGEKQREEEERGGEIAMCLVPVFCLVCQSKNTANTAIVSLHFNCEQLQSLRYSRTPAQQVSVYLCPMYICICSNCS